MKFLKKLKYENSHKVFCCYILLLYFISNKGIYAQNKNVFSIEGGIPFGWKNKELTIEENSSIKEYKNFTLSVLYSRIIKNKFGIEAGINFTNKGNTLCSKHYTGNTRWLSVLAGANYSFPLFNNFYMISFINLGVALVEYGQQQTSLVTYYVDYNENQLTPIFKGGFRFAYELHRFRFFSALIMNICLFVEKI